MNLSTACSILALASTASAFAPIANNARATSSLQMGTPGMDLSGNSWVPDSEKMGVSEVSEKKEQRIVSKASENEYAGKMAVFGIQEKHSRSSNNHSFF